MTVQEAIESINNLRRTQAVKDLMLKNLKEGKSYRKGQCDECGNVLNDWFGVKECVHGLPEDYDSDYDCPICPEKYENDSEVCPNFRLPKIEKENYIERDEDYL